MSGRCAAFWVVELRDVVSVVVSMLGKVVLALVIIGMLMMPMD